MTDTDPLVRDLAELITEWRKTCAQMGIRYTDQQAAQFVIDSGLIDTHDAAVVAAVTPLIEQRKAEQIADRLDSEGHLWSGAPAHAFFNLADWIRGGLQ